MAHPDGGHGNFFQTRHTFNQALAYVGNGKITFQSTTGENIIATRGMAQDGVTPTIVFEGENNRHGNVCHACWGYRSNCSKTRIGQCTEALDQQIS